MVDFNTLDDFDFEGKTVLLSGWNSTKHLTR